MREDQAWLAGVRGEAGVGGGAAVLSANGLLLPAWGSTTRLRWGSPFSQHDPLLISACFKGPFQCCAMATLQHNSRCTQLAFLVMRRASPVAGGTGRLATACANSCCEAASSWAGLEAS